MIRLATRRRNVNTGFGTMDYDTVTVTVTHEGRTRRTAHVSRRTLDRRYSGSGSELKACR